MHTCVSLASYCILCTSIELSSFPFPCLFVCCINWAAVAAAVGEELWHIRPHSHDGQLDLGHPSLWHLLPSLPFHLSTKALDSNHLAPALSPHPVLAALLCKKGGSRVAVLGLLAGGTVEPAAPVSGLHWEATPPHTRLCEAARASQRREGGRPPTGVPTPTHHHPIKLKLNAIHPALANPNPQHNSFPSQNFAKKNQHKYHPREASRYPSEWSLYWPKLETRSEVYMINLALWVSNLDHTITWPNILHRPKFKEQSVPICLLICFIFSFLQQETYI